MSNVTYVLRHHPLETPIPMVRGELSRRMMASRRP
jgi:hypothetical protein